MRLSYAILYGSLVRLFLHHCNLYFIFTLFYFYDVQCNWFWLETTKHAIQNEWCNGDVWWWWYIFYWRNSLWSRRFYIIFILCLSTSISISSSVRVFLLLLLFFCLRSSFVAQPMMCLRVRIAIGVKSLIWWEYLTTCIETVCQHYLYVIPIIFLFASGHTANHWI